MQRTNAQESARVRKAGPGALSTLYRKELADHLHSARFFIIFALLGITSLASLASALGIGVGALGLATIGVPPSGEELMRIGAYLLFTVVYTALWLALAMLCSVLCRHAATSALIVIAVWIFLTMFATMIAGAIADMAYPTDGIMGFANMMDNYELELTLNRISPYYLYCEAVSTLLSPNVRTLGITTQSSLSGAIASYLSFDQSLLLVWPHLTCMIALVMAAFTVAYISFMRQEIRA